MSVIDPTANVLATIANIFKHHDAEPNREPEHPVADQQPLVPEPTDADGYTRFGPGPMAAIRFKWTVQRGEDGAYYVHETIGEHSAPIVNGPMTGEAAVRFVDNRESESRQRFEELRTEIASRTAVSELMRGGGSDV